MTLALAAVRHADEQFADPKTMPLTAVHCTIGRGHDCDVVLEDPTRHISRRHAVITRHDDSYVLTVESRINPVFVNGLPVSAGERAVLALGDSIVVGDYEFNVVSGSAGGAASATPAGKDPFAGLAGGAQGGPVDLDAIFGAPSARIPQKKPVQRGIDEILGSPKAAPNDPLLDILSGGSGSREAATPFFADQAPSQDPLLQILGQSPDAAPAPTTGAPDEILHRNSNEFSIDHIIGGSSEPEADPLGLSRDVPRPQARGQFGGDKRGSLELDHVADVHLPLPAGFGQATSAEVPPWDDRRTNEAAYLPEPPTVPASEADPLAALFRGAGPEKDPLGLLAPSAAAKPAASPRSPKPTSPTTPQVPFEPVTVLRDDTDVVLPDSPGVPAALTPAAQPAATQSTQAAIQAFLAGAGMSGVSIPADQAEAFLRECGATVRAAVEGIMGMLLARAKVKEELRAADRTMVASKENNALKLIETVDEALMFVFDPATRTDAFLAPPKAVADACTDLQAHELALVAGMRSALMGAIARFEPAVIEKRLEKEGTKSLLSNKKALLWDCFVAYYQQTEKDAEDNFDRVFGAAFLRAYQEQVRRLKH